MQLSYWWHIYKSKQNWRMCFHPMFRHLTPLEPFKMYFRSIPKHNKCTRYQLPSKITKGIESWPHILTVEKELESSSKCHSLSENYWKCGWWRWWITNYNWLQICLLVCGGGSVEVCSQGRGFCGHLTPSI